MRTQRNTPRARSLAAWVGACAVLGCARAEISAPCTELTPPAAEAEPTADAAPDGDADLTLDRWVLAARPLWADRYATSAQQQLPFLAVEVLMHEWSLDRTEVVEVQNFMRDTWLARGGALDRGVIEDALARVRAGHYEALDRARLASAKVIVAVDLDETLIDQSIEVDLAALVDCPVHWVEIGERRVAVAVRPGLARLLDRVVALGGVVVVDSANLDDNVHANVRALPVGAGLSLAAHPAVVGVLANSHLTLQAKRGAGNSAHAARVPPSRPVLEPFKDLRILDAALERVILVDDNPIRVFQPRQLRLIEKYDADRICTTSPRDALRRGADTAWDVIGDEIEESLRWATDHGQPFSRAWAPYSQAGGVAMAALRRAGLRDAAARAHLRAHPELIDAEF